MIRLEKGLTVKLVYVIQASCVKKTGHVIKKVMSFLLLL
jgi:hypothetical protein